MTLKEATEIRDNKINELNNSFENKKSKEYHEELHKIESEYCYNVKMIFRKMNGN